MVGEETRDRFELDVDVNYLRVRRAEIRNGPHKPDGKFRVTFWRVGGLW